MGLHYHFLRLTCQVKSPCLPAAVLSNMGLSLLTGLKAPWEPSDPRLSLWSVVLGMEG